MCLQQVVLFLSRGGEIAPKLAPAHFTFWANAKCAHPIPSGK
jgi:hypothetical protein